MIKEIENETLSMLIDTPEGDKQVAYQRWFNPLFPDAPILFCVHGLTRNRHDFDMLAPALAENYQVITVDIIGRGDSDRMDDGMLYGYPLYISQMMQMIQFWLDKTGQKEVHWVGTSMGGLIGMMIASLPETPISRMVLNDVGTFIPLSALQRLGDYVGKAPPFDSLDDVEKYFRLVAKPFGPLTDAQWAHLAKYGADQDEDGRWRLRYDSQISLAFVGLDNDVDLSDVWNAVTIPILILRGADSDLLTKENVIKMCERPETELVEFEGIGHAPVLMSDDQIKVVTQYLIG